MSVQGTKRLTKEFKMIKENPPPFIIATPEEDNIFVWHYVITGPPDTPYTDGQYHGTLVFPSDYPFKPPAIRMTTPNGRFRENTRLCLSMSDHHPDTWNPSWSVSTILTGLLSFMTGDEETSGSISTHNSYKRLLARQSKVFNATKNPKFKAVFPDLVSQNLKDIEELEKQEESGEQQGACVSWESLEKESAVSVEEIADPEDRIRAEQLALRGKEGIDLDDKRRGFSSSWVIFTLFVVAVACFIQ